MKKSIIKAYAPASIGNVNLGFDILGAALKPLDHQYFGDEIWLEPATEFGLTAQGEYANVLPMDIRENIVSHCYQYFNEQLQREHSATITKTFQMTLIKNLPIGSGLGSSASSIVAALVALNYAYGNPFSSEKMLKMMGYLEGRISGNVHYDNVASSYQGGLVLLTNDSEPHAINLPIFEDWFWVVSYPGIKISTAEARCLLPQQIDLSKALTFGQQLGIFCNALHTGNRPLAASVMHDVIAEPYRKNLLPGFNEAKQYCMQHGALCFGISGSGPTVFAVTDDKEKALSIKKWLADHYVHNSKGFSLICKLDPDGSKIIRR